MQSAEVSRRFRAAPQQPADDKANPAAKQQCEQDLNPYEHFSSVW
jgi:hypothetical protein